MYALDYFPVLVSEFEHNSLEVRSKPQNEGLTLTTHTEGAI